MTMPFIRPATVPAWRLTDARVPSAMLAAATIVRDKDGFARVDLTIEDGKLTGVLPAGTPSALSDSLPVINLGGRMVVPTLVDAHTHIDKGHIAHRTPDADGTHGGAVRSVMADRAANWNAADVRQRMTFSLDCAYAHGTSALRTHIDSLGPQARISWPVLAEIRDAWRGRVDVQASPLFGIDTVEDEAHMRTVLEMVRMTGCGLLGAVTYMTPRIREQLRAFFRIASDHGLDLDFHVDETNDPSSRSLALIAETALEFRFTGRILAGHCCSLSLQDDAEAARTIEAVAKAGISVVSLPMCNIYLQDRDASQGGRTPRWRGVTAVKELATAGVEVIIASDNTRDPFYAYGDLDMVEVWREGTWILQLDHPVGDWARVVGPAPARAMGLPQEGQLTAGAAADLVVLDARSWTELFARPHSDRLVIRSGMAISTSPPSYERLYAG